jgi:two-component sensor histidine kinase
MTFDQDDKDARAAPGPFPWAVAEDHAAALRDPARLRALEETALLDSPEEEAFDRAVRLACSLTGAPTALFSLVDDTRQFFKALRGFETETGPMRETPLSHSFCQYVVTGNAALSVVDAREHDLLSQNLAVPDLNVVAYLGVPVQGRRGQVIGSLCAIDSSPHEWSTQDERALKDIAAFLETEIALRKHMTERELLIDELNHRIRNIYSVINALVRMTRAEDLTTEEFAAQLNGRVQALAATHGLIQPLATVTEDAGNDTSLHAHVSTLMAPYTGAGGHDIRIQGPDLPVGSTASIYLALAIHELSTNAVKYGALSGPDRALEIIWTDDDDAIELTWRETGPGHVARAASGTGFGSKLVKLCIERQLRGEMNVATDSAGLTYTFRIPRDTLTGAPLA